VATAHAAPPGAASAHACTKTQRGNDLMLRNGRSEPVEESNRLRNARSRRTCSVRDGALPL